MSEFTALSDANPYRCWWCDAPVDPIDDDHVTVHMEKVTIENVTNRLEKRTTQTTSFIIPRCPTCKALQKKQGLLQIIPGAGVIVGGGFGFYLGYLIQGEQGALSWVIAIAIAAISIGFGVWQSVRFSSRHPDQDKQIIDYPPVKILLDQGWKVK